MVYHVYAYFAQVAGVNFNSAFDTWDARVHSTDAWVNLDYYGIILIDPLEVCPLSYLVSLPLVLLSMDLQFIIGDSIVIWRTWMIWNGTWPCLIPIFMGLGAFGKRSLVYPMLKRSRRLTTVSLN